MKCLCLCLGIFLVLIAPATLPHFSLKPLPDDDSRGPGIISQEKLRSQTVAKAKDSHTVANRGQHGSADGVVDVASQSQSVTVVKQSMTVNGIDYIQLISNPTLSNEFELATRMAIAKEARHGVTAEDVAVVLEKGSVKVHSTIAHPLQVRASTLSNSLSASMTMAETLRSAIIAVPNIDSITTGEILVDNLLSPSVEVIDRRTKQQFLDADETTTTPVLVITDSEEDDVPDPLVAATSATTTETAPHTTTQSTITATVTSMTRTRTQTTTTTQSLSTTSRTATATTASSTLTSYTTSTSDTSTVTNTLKVTETRTATTTETSTTRTTTASTTFTTWTIGATTRTTTTTGSATHTTISSTATTTSRTVDITSTATRTTRTWTTITATTRTTTSGTSSWTTTSHTSATYTTETRTTVLPIFDYLNHLPRTKMIATEDSSLASTTTKKPPSSESLIDPSTGVPFFLPHEYVEQSNALIRAGAAIKLYAVGSSNILWMTWIDQLHLYLKRLGYKVPVVPTRTEAKLHPTEVQTCPNTRYFANLATARLGKIGWHSWDFAYEDWSDCNVHGYRHVAGHSVKCEHGPGCKFGTEILSASSIAEDASGSDITFVSTWYNDDQPDAHKCFGGHAIPREDLVQMSISCLVKTIKSIHDVNPSVWVIVMGKYGVFHHIVDPWVTSLNDKVKEAVEVFPRTLFVDYGGHPPPNGGWKLFELWQNPMSEHAGHLNCRGDKLLALEVLHKLFDEKILERGVKLVDFERKKNNRSCDLLGLEGSAACRTSALCWADPGDGGRCKPYGAGTRTHRLLLQEEFAQQSVVT